MWILVFTAVAILAWLGAPLFVNMRRSQRPGARAESDSTSHIADEARRWLEQLDDSP